jgi:hypothetical protein
VHRYLSVSSRPTARTLAVVLAVFIAVVGLQIMQFNSTASATHVPPVLVDAAYWEAQGEDPADFKNPTCSDIDSGAWEWKWEGSALSDGTHSGSWGPWDLSYEIDNDGSSEPKLVDWESTVGVFSIFIKASTGGLYYQYPDGSPKTESGMLGNPLLLFGDEGLVAQEGRGISHISFCLPNELQVSKTAETSFDLYY